MKEKIKGIIVKLLWKVAKAVVSGFSLLLGLAEVLVKIQSERKKGGIK